MSTASLRSIAAFFVCLLFAEPVGAQGKGLVSLDTIVPALMKRYDVPGVSLAIVRGDSVIALKGFGFARVADSTLVDPRRTLFRLASVSKLFVALAVMQQTARGGLDLDADVNRYLQLSVPDRWRQPLTLHRLLTHTAGFDERLIGYAALSRDSVSTLGSHLASNLPGRGWAPGEVIGYSNYGFALAAHLVERASDMSFAHYARSRIFLPLGMMRTFYVAAPDSLVGDVAIGHICTDGSCRPASELFLHPYPAGLAYSTAADMAQFLIAQLNGGFTRAGRALDSASMNRMQRQQFTADSMLPGMSYAFFNQRHRGQRVLSNAGSVPGINNLLLIVPDKRIGVYFAANGGRSAFGAALRDTLLSLLAPGAAPEPPPAVHLDDDYLRTLAGPYQIVRYSRNTIERFPLLSGTSVRVRVEDNRLVIPVGATTVMADPIDSLRFREVDGERVFAFRRDARGRVTHLFAPIPAFGAELPGTLERRAWHDTPYFMNAYVSWLVGVPLLLLIVAWPIATAVAWFRKRGRYYIKYHERHYWSRAALGAAAAFTALWGLFGFTFIARSTRMLEQASGIVYGVPMGFRALAMVPWGMSVLGIAMVASAVVAWRQHWWDGTRRTLYTVVSFAAVLTIAFLIRWNYLPATF